MAYQIRDDLEDLGQAVSARTMPEGRPTILWALAHKSAKGDAKKTLAESWSRGGATEAAAIHALFAELDVEGQAAELLAAYKEQAVRSLRVVDNANVKGLLRRTLGKIFDDLQIKGWCNEFETRDAASGTLVTAAAG